MPTAADIVAELKTLGRESIKKVLLKHGAREPFYGVKVEDLKKIQKRVKRDHALALAARRRPQLREALDALSPRLHDGDDELARRMQQLSGATMAKGTEDTAFYRYARFVALNEVGADPDELGIDLEAFHAAQVARQERQPRSMTGLSTHDTKRGEDVRARIAVLAEMPAAWAEVLDQLLAAVPVPDASFGNLLTLPVGGGLLYVTPVYTQRQGGNGSYPALTFVVVRFGQSVGIGDTLQQALDQVFKGNSGASTGEGDEPAKPTQPTGQTDSSAATQALDDFDKAIGELETYTLSDGTLDRQRAGLVRTGPRVSDVLRQFLDAAQEGDVAAVQGLVPEVTSAITEFQQAATGG